MAGDTGNHVYRGERKPNGENTQRLHCAFPAGGAFRYSLPGQRLTFSNQF